MILPGMLIEGFTYFHPLPRRKDGLQLNWAVQIAYAVLVFYMGLSRGNWVYPFMALMPMPLRCAFGLVSGVVTSGYYIVGEKIHKVVWRKHLKEQ